MHGQHHIETMVHLMCMDLHPNQPQGNPFPYPFPTNVFSQGEYRSPRGQSKSHSQAQCEKIYPLLGTNIHSSEIPYPQLNLVGAINFCLGQHFVTYNKVSPTCDESKPHLTPSYTAWTKLPREVPQETNISPNFLGTPFSSSSYPGSTTLVAHIQSQQLSTSKISTSM